VNRTAVRGPDGIAIPPCQDAPHAREEDDRPVKQETDPSSLSAAKAEKPASAQAVLQSATGSSGSAPLPSPAPHGSAQVRSMKDRVLFVDDDPDQCELIASNLTRQGFVVRTTTSVTEALSLLASEVFDVVLTDIGLDEMSGLDLCERILGIKPDTVVIVVTAQATMESAIEAMRVGAFDFLVKPVDSKLLALSVARALKHRRLTEEVKLLRENAGRVAPGTLIGESPSMKRVYDLLHRVAASDASVLIHGETGTGKELIARAIHSLSPRKSGPFTAINCAAVPPTLLESELFGHARGAFTDAKTSRHGLFVEATGGTLFLDEIGEMPMEVQPKLLRALQERKVRPVGESTEVHFDARLVVATNRDLESAVYEKRFREDLFYRINVVKIELPPLRERGSDVLALATHFLDKFAKQTGKPSLSLSVQVAERLTSYDWPGNVRELENCIERAVALSRFDQIVVEDLPEKIRAYRTDRFVVAADDPIDVVTMDELERRYLLRVLKLVGGNKSRAAQMLGLDRRTLYRKLERYEEAAKNGHAGAAHASSSSSSSSST
jgi:DNA-binding NtrC family response regulator